VTSDVLVAVSLKAYFGYIETCGWLRDVANMLTDHPLPASVERAVLPSFSLLDRTHHMLARFGVTAGAQDVCSAGEGRQPARSRRHCLPRWVAAAPK
jgi:hypothetical protein